MLPALLRLDHLAGISRRRENRTKELKDALDLLARRENDDYPTPCANALHRMITGNPDPLFQAAGQEFPPMTVTTVNTAAGPELDEPITRAVYNEVLGQSESLAAVQPVPTPDELAQWIQANTCKPEALDAVSEMRERRDAVERILSVTDSKPIPRFTGDLIRETSTPEWSFIVQPVIRAWTDAQRDPDLTVPERFVITGWLQESNDEAWTLLAPGANGELETVSGGAEGLMPLAKGNLYEFHASRTSRNSPHRLWHVNTLNLNPADASIRRINLNRHNRFRGE